MSADNGVYIIVTKKPKGTGSEYRIGYAHAIENLFLEPTRYLNKIFGKSPVLDRFDHAEMYAEGLADQYLHLEYGVNVIRGLEKYTYDELVNWRNRNDHDYEE